VTDGPQTSLGISGRIARFFVSSQLTPLIGLVLALAGAFALIVTPREEEPQIDVTMASVFVPFPGASAADVERLVAVPAEQVLSQIQGLEHVWSASRPGQALITVQYNVGVKRNDAVVRLHDTILSHKDWLPPELGVGDPLVKPKGIDDVPILAVTLWTKDPQRGAYELERVAHAVEVELKRVPGTREVTTIGGPGRVVQVELDIEKLNAHGLAAADLRRMLAAANTALPAGDLVHGNETILVETGAFLESAKQVRELTVGVHNGAPVYLADVARVVDGPPPAARYAWHGVGKAGIETDAGSTSPAVTIVVTKKVGENAVDVAARVEQRLAQLSNTVIPTGIETTVTRDYGQTANDKAKLLISKLLFATLSVVALVFVTLGRREATIVGVAVMLTLAATLFASWAWGFTLNRVSLFALIFSIGILVDDAIVVVENIHRHRMLEPDAPVASLIPRAVDEVGGPTILATFTVIAALLPMAFVTGLMGPYMSPIPINASMGMLISLGVAFMITPWLAAKLIGGPPRLAADAAALPPEGEQCAPWGGPAPRMPAHGHASNAESRLDRWLASAFMRLLTPFVDPERGGRRRRLLGAGIVVAILGSVALAFVELVVLKMLPFDNKSEFQVIVDMPAGTPVEATAAALADLGAFIATVDEVVDYQAYAGTASPINFNGLVRQYDLRQMPEQGDLQVNLTDRKHRSRKSHEIALAVRPKLEEIGARHKAKVKVVEVPPGPPVLSPIVAEIYGPDEAGRHALAKGVRGAFGATAGIVGIDDSIEDNAPRALVRIDQRKAALSGVTPADIVATLRMALAGDDVTALHDGQAKYGVPVRITLPPSRQGRLDTLLTMTVRAPGGANVPLSELVDVQPAFREKTIYHKDLLPVTYVIGDMAGGADSPLYGMFGARSRVGDVAVPNGGTLAEYFISQPAEHYRGYALKWDGEWQVTYETFRDMGIAYAVGLVLIYLLVVAQFGSYLTPLVIMAPIPLTIIGVMPGHALLRAPFTATSMIGMIALAGIIVRNSILLVDFVNLQLARSVPFAQAIVDAAAARAKPIALTGLAAMAGAFFILDDPIFNGLAIALIFGILVSTLLTLVVIPVLYFAVNRRQHE
jgi:multidrug efflux pump subunit AcrB